MVEEGDRLRKRGDWINAEESYRRATEVDPEDRVAWTELGCLLVDSRRFSEAVVCLRRIVNNGVPATDDPQESVRLLAEIVAARPIGFVGNTAWAAPMSIWWNMIGRANISRTPCGWIRPCWPQ